MIVRLPEKLLRHRILWDGAWVAGGQALSAVAALASIRIMTELLPAEEFGRLTLMIGAAVLVQGLTIDPLLQGVLRFYVDWKRRGEGDILRAASAVILVPVAAASCLALALLGWLGGATFGLTPTGGILIAALLTAGAARAFELALFNAARRQKPAAFLYVGEAWIRPVAAVAVVALWRANAEAALLGYFIGSVAVVVAIRFLTQLEGTAQGSMGHDGVAFLRSDAGRALRSSLFRYALPLVPLAILSWFNGIGDRYVIGGMRGLEEAGLYAAAYGLVSKPFLMLGTMTELLFRPILFDAVAAANINARKHVKRLWLWIMGLGSALGVLCFMLFGHYLATIVLAPTYREAADEMMNWIALGYAFCAMSLVQIRFCYAFNDTRAALLLTAASSVVMLVGLLVLLKLYGLIGAAIAVPIYFGFQWALSAALARRAERNWDGRTSAIPRQGEMPQT